MTKLTLEIPDSLHRSIKSLEKKPAKKPAKMGAKTKKKLSKYITEEEADAMLKPYLLRLVKRIEGGEEETYTWEEVKKKGLV